MKKIFLLLAAVATVSFSAKAEVLLKDSFNYALGNLAYGNYQDMGDDQSKWWYMTGSTDILVVDTNLTAAGYQSKPSGKAIKMRNSNKRDIRAFNSVSGNGKSVYYSFLLNVDSIKTSTSKVYITGLTGTSTASGAAAIYGEVRLTYKAPSSFQIGVTKANEVGVRYAPSAIPFDSTVLVVVRYDFIEGEKNDECYLWINPTKLDEAKPTTQCVQDTASGSGNPWGANQKVDPSALFTCNITGSSFFSSIFIDEVRVATKWADLFEVEETGEVLMEESFDRPVGDLNSGDYKDMGTDLTNWWYTSTSTSTKVQVIDTALTKAGYQTNPAGKAIQFKGNAQKDVRAFSRVSSVAGKSIYYSVLLNVKALKKSTSRENLITLTDASITAGYCYAELRFLNNYDDNTYQLGVTKANENGVRWSKPLPLDSTILAVIRYDFIEGDTNDVASLWINPTKLDEGKPTTQSVQDTASGSGAKWGANQKVDPSGLKWVYLKPTTNTANIILDEIRVATKWADLFEGEGKKPAIGVNTSLSFDQMYQDTQAKKELSITASNLKGDITVSHTHADITLSAATIAKDSAEAGTKLTVSLNAATVGAQIDTIVLSSQDVEKKVVVSWTVFPVVACATVADLKDSAALVEEYAGTFRLTGEAIVTRDTTLSDREIYVQDATGAAKLFDSYGYCSSNLVGAKVSGLMLNNGGASFGVQPFYILQVPTVVSTGNKVEPQVVTLAELQANAEDYLLEVVTIQKVAFTNAGETFSAKQWAATQGDESVNIKVENNNIVGKKIPEKAHVTGFSLNTNGTVIVPRNNDDIVEYKTQLLGNGSFEKWKVSSAGVLGKNTDFEDWNVQGIIFGGKVVDSTDVLDGKYAFKTTKDHTNKGAYIYQELDAQNFALNDEFKIRIGYKNLNTVDSALVLDCYWAGSKSGAAIEQAEDLKQALSYQANWKTIELTTNKPEGAKYFMFKIKIYKSAQVLLDNCAFTYMDPIITQVEQTNTTPNKARKFMQNGMLYIERNGVIYTILGNK